MSKHLWRVLNHVAEDCKTLPPLKICQLDMHTPKNFSNNQDPLYILSKSLIPIKVVTNLSLFGTAEITENCLSPPFHLQPYILINNYYSIPAILERKYHSNTSILEHYYFSHPSILKHRNWHERAAFQRSAFGRSTAGNDVLLKTSQ